MTFRTELPVAMTTISMEFFVPGELAAGTCMQVKGPDGQMHRTLVPDELAADLILSIQISVPGSPINQSLRRDSRRRSPPSRSAKFCDSFSRRRSPPSRLTSTNEVCIGNKNKAIKKETLRTPNASLGNLKTQIEIYQNL